MTFNKQHSIAIPSGTNLLDGLLYIPQQASGLVLFVHGSGSSRFSKRNQFVAQYLNEANLATLLFDLLTPAEDRIDNVTREFRFDIGLLASRLIDVTQWCLNQPALQKLNIGYFGASTGGGAALVAAAALPDAVHAVVSRGGRPDLAATALSQVVAPTLLIVGGLDEVVIGLNQAAMSQMHSTKQLEIVPGATHLFEEPGTLTEVARLARAWFLNYLPKA
jgi:pimeloyl-ACP methyl ester carboxylesterase